MNVKSYFLEKIRKKKKNSIRLSSAEYANAQDDLGVFCLHMAYGLCFLRCAAADVFAETIENATDSKIIKIHTRTTSLMQIWCSGY